MLTYWKNPWACVTYVPIAELAAICREDNSWADVGYNLDAYIMPKRGGGFSLGVRFGNEFNNYISPYCGDNEAVKKLYNKYRVCLTPGTQFIATSHGDTMNFEIVLPSDREFSEAQLKELEEVFHDEAERILAFK